MIRMASLKCLSFTRSVMTTISAMPSWLRFCTIWAMLTSLLPRTPAILASAPARFSTCKPQEESALRLLYIQYRKLLVAVAANLAAASMDNITHHIDDISQYRTGGGHLSGAPSHEHGIVASLTMNKYGIEGISDRGKRMAVRDQCGMYFYFNSFTCKLCNTQAV